MRAPDYAAHIQTNVLRGDGGVSGEGENEMAINEALDQTQINPETVNSDT